MSSGLKTVYRGLLTCGEPAPSGTDSQLPQFDPVIVEATVEPGDTVGVISDGIESFWRPDSTPMSWLELLPEFTGFKNYPGVFVHRRMASLGRHCREEAIVHKDDISIAAIHL